MIFSILKSEKDFCLERLFIGSNISKTKSLSKFSFLPQICDIKHMCAKTLFVIAIFLLYFSYLMNLSPQLDAELFLDGALIISTLLL